MLSFIIKCQVTALKIDISLCFVWCDFSPWYLVFKLKIISICMILVVHIIILLFNWWLSSQLHLPFYYSIDG